MTTEFYDSSQSIYVYLKLICLAIKKVTEHAIMMMMAFKLKARL